ncbi:hypothetical protein [Peribacillus asahii]|uniref:hypothetical protein n=1 Tax=Peribacillus asahii TaxID=228899 RepID=UPI0037F23E1B
MRMTEDDAFVRRSELRKRFKRYGVGFESRREGEKLIERLHKEDVLPNRKRSFEFNDISIEDGDEILIFGGQEFGGVLEFNIHGFVKRIKKEFIVIADNGRNYPLEMINSYDISFSLLNK